MILRTYFSLQLIKFYCVDYHLFLLILYIVGSDFIAFFCDSPCCLFYHVKSNCSCTIFRGRGKVTTCSEHNVKSCLQSETMFLKLVTTNWYNWNTRNRKTLVLILMNAANPIQAKFSEGFIVNFKLLMFVSHIFEIFRDNFHCVCLHRYSRLSTLLCRSL
jgi:hypothetical protein